MTEETRQDETNDAPVIESASATTDPNNATSGPFAYVLTAVVVVVLAVLVSGVSSWATSMSRLVASTDSLSYGTGYDGYYEYDYDDTDDLDDLLDNLEELLGDSDEYEEPNRQSVARVG